MRIDVIILTPKNLRKIELLIFFYRIFIQLIHFQINLALNHSNKSSDFCKIKINNSSKNAKKCRKSNQSSEINIDKKHFKSKNQNVLVKC